MIEHLFLYICSASRLPPGFRAFLGTLDMLKMYPRLTQLLLGTASLQYRGFSTWSEHILSDASLVWWSTLIPESSGALFLFLIYFFNLSAFQASFVTCSTPFEISHCHPYITKGGILAGCFQGSVMESSLVRVANLLSSTPNSNRTLLLN